MFTAEDIMARLRERPFVPVRIITSSGQSYDVTHPDLVLVMRRALYIGVPSRDNPTIAETATHLAVMHVTEMQPLPTAGSSTPTNGQSSPPS